MKTWHYHSNTWYSSTYNHHNSNFDFLKGLETDFTKEFKEGRIARAKPLSFQKKFVPNLRSKMHYYNVNHTKLSQDAKVVQIMSQIEDMKSVLDHNIRLVLRNQEEQLDVMEKRSSEMKRDSVVFKKRSEVLLASTKRKSRMKHCLFAGVLLAVLYMVLVATCGFTFASCRRKGGE